MRFAVICWAPCLVAFLWLVYVCRTARGDESKEVPGDLDQDFDEMLNHPDELEAGLIAEVESAEASFGLPLNPDQSQTSPCG